MVIPVLFDTYLLALAFTYDTPRGVMAMEAGDTAAGGAVGQSHTLLASEAGTRGGVEAGGDDVSKGCKKAVQTGRVNKEALLCALHECVEELGDWFKARGMAEHLTSWCKSGRRMAFKVSQHPTSFNLPLHRAVGQLFATALVAQDSEAGGEGPSCLTQAFSFLRQKRGFARCLLEHPLRTQVLTVQVESLVWVHNGYSLRTQASIYSTARFRGRDLDMLVLQMVRRPPLPLPLPMPLPLPLPSALPLELPLSLPLSLPLPRPLMLLRLLPCC